jgi:hypothetical protein
MLRINRLESLDGTFGRCPEKKSLTTTFKSGSIALRLTQQRGRTMCSKVMITPTQTLPITLFALESDCETGRYLPPGLFSKLKCKTFIILKFKVFKNKKWPIFESGLRSSCVPPPQNHAAVKQPSSPPTETSDEETAAVVSPKRDLIVICY